MSTCHPAMDGVDVGGTVQAVEIVTFWFNVLTDVSVYQFSLFHTLFVC